jgi:hypothetical protein
MEYIVELLLALLWDTTKTLILQWLIDFIKSWWTSRKNSAGLQSA